MLVCTFTRTAAQDLARELAQLGVGGAEDVRVGTLHAFCFGLLGRDEVLLATGRVSRPLMDFERRFLLEDLKSDFGGVFKCRKRIQAFEAAWARMQSETPGGPTDAEDRAFHARLLGWLRFHEAMLIGELVPECLRYLGENPASQHRNAFDNVLVDEYQDLNRAEQALLDLLSESGDLIVVGDEDQSIYAFKYAYPEGISSFHKSHAATHDKELRECRRCPQRIVKMANALISNNHRRLPRTLLPRPGNPEGEVMVLQWHNMDEEATGIAQIISRRIRRGNVEPGGILVLAPRRQFAYKIRDALLEQDIYARSFFAEQALDEEFAKRAFALLSLLVNPDDRVALRCWCGFGSPSFIRNAWERLRSHCHSTGDSPRVALGKLSAGELNMPNMRPLIRRFEELCRRLFELSPLRGHALANAIFPESEEWAAPLWSSIDLDMNRGEFDAEQLHESLLAAITKPELPTEVDYVRIMSLHKSKGLTADMVVVVGCIEGLVPRIEGESHREKDSSLEEQRRLFYVAITRTSQYLTLSSVSELPRDIAHKMRAQVRGTHPRYALTFASRFLHELGPERPESILGSVAIQ